MVERIIKAALVLWCKLVHCILVQNRNCHKKATCDPATRCHWLFQSSMVACSGRPVDGTTTKGMGGNQPSKNTKPTKPIMSTIMSNRHHPLRIIAVEGLDCRPGKMAFGRRSQILGRICEDRCAPGTASLSAKAKRIENCKPKCHARCKL